jgi:spermidine/putrescine transport system ATP-binding protein
MNKSSYISLQKIAKTYTDGFLAVSDINLEINKGEFVTLLGPSGCGKTTILKMIAGFDNPTEGRIVINNIDVKDLPANNRSTATVFQDYALFPNMNVIENIKYGIKLIRVKKDPNEYPKQLEKELEQIKKEALTKSKHEIVELKRSFDKIKKELEKEISAYERHEA